MTVIATARMRPPGTVEGGVTFVDTPTLLADSDVITVHTPLPPQTNPELRNLHPNRTITVSST
jgi:phosphoglycerate dehydrogenase-like enzyme